MIPTSARPIRLLQKTTWRKGLVTLRFEKPEGYFFAPGQFVRLGVLAGDGKETYAARPYSFASNPNDPFLEFYVVAVENGLVSPVLTNMEAGDAAYIENELWGQLLPGRIKGGSILWCLSSGTGLAPFISILQDNSTWDQWNKIVLVHSVRELEDLSYARLMTEFSQNSGFGEGTDKYFRYIPIVTRAPSQFLSRRIQELIKTGTLQDETGVEFDPVESRVLICGNPDMVKAVRAELKPKGFSAPRRGQPGNLLAENLW